MLRRREFVAGSALAMMSSRTNAAELLATNGPRPVELSGQSVHVALEPRREGLLAILLEAGSRRITLVCRDISAKKPPRTPFLIFLNAAENPSLTPEDAGFVGALSLFGGSARDGEMQFPAVSFEIGEAVQRLKRVGRLAVPLSLTFIGRRKPDPGSDLKIAQIDLFFF